MHQNAAGVLSAKWGYLGAATKIEAVAGALNINSRNYQVWVNSQTARPTHCLKSVAVAQVERLERACRLQHMAGSRGVWAPSVCRPEGTTEGEWAVLYAGTGWALQEWRDGRTPQCGGPETTAIAEELARLHSALRGETVPSESSDYEDLSDVEVAGITREVRGHADAEAGGAWTTLAKLPEWQRRMRVLDGVSPVQPIHLDCHVANVLIDAVGRPTLLDYESIVLESRMLAIGFACSRIAGYDRVMGDRFLAAYDTIDPLSPDERRMWPLFAAREAMRRVNYVLRARYLGGDRTWEFELGRQAESVERGLRL